ncbi:MAG: hypothetical protein IH830_14460 [Planctomycetes bacterium]|nr:hypothetical protein [Planctomycetota bacterium]
MQMSNQISMWLRIAVVAAVVFVTPFAQGRGPVAQPKMGDPLLGLTAAQLDRFDVGKTAFGHVFTEAEGLGPVFNKTACGGCHNNPIGGSGVTVVTRFGTIDGMGKFDPLAELGGSLLQAEAISDPCAEQIPVEATIQTFRLTPSALGFGLTEAIPDRVLLANADPDDLNSDGISGRVHMVEALEAPGVPRVGRFGWKAQVATLLTFSAGAALNEIGLTNILVPVENDPNGINPPSLGPPDNCDTVPDFEDNFLLGNGTDKYFIDVVTDFQRFLAAPPQTPKSGMTGEALFISIGCADCHLPQFTTADDPSLEDAIRNKVIHPYSDYLLHDMGAAGDSIVQGDAEAQEIRTMPLRGLRVRDPMWHDGRAAGGFFEGRIKQVVACHCASGSEAQSSAQRYLSGTVANCPDSLPTGGDGFTCDPGIVKGGLDDDQRAAVIAFLASLGRREFNHAGLLDIDDKVGPDDFVAFASCFDGGPYTPDDFCAIDDVDQDGDVDLDDFTVFLTVYNGPLEDCNTNKVLDLLDILNGSSPDANGNGIPDECECLGDLSGPVGVPDGVVDAFDLAVVLAGWCSAMNDPIPPSPPCENCSAANLALADLTGPANAPDGCVDAFDLAKILAGWGLCP